MGGHFFVLVAGCIVLPQRLVVDWCTNTCRVARLIVPHLISSQAWEEHYSALFEANGFERLKSVPVAFVHKELDMIGGGAWRRLHLGGLRRGPRQGAQGAGEEVRTEEPRGDLDQARAMCVRSIIEYADGGITWSGDPRHQKLLEDYFGMDDTTKVPSKNFYDEDGRSEQDTSSRVASLSQRHRSMVCTIEPSWLVCPCVLNCSSRGFWCRNRSRDIVRRMIALSAATAVVMHSSVHTMSDVQLNRHILVYCGSALTPEMSIMSVAVPSCGWIFRFLKSGSRRRRSRSHRERQGFDRGFDRSVTGGGFNTTERKQKLIGEVPEQQRHSCC